MSEKIKCATFDKAMQDGIPPEIRARMNVDRITAQIKMRDYWVTVCDKCFQASCWHGDFLCQDAQHAGTTEMKASWLIETKREHSENYSIENLMRICGRVRYIDAVAI